MANVIGTSVANVLNGTSAADSLFGAAGNDTLDGANGNDTLNGGTGNDSMAGGAGNDLYLVDSVNDKVIEAANGGTDTVQSSVTWTLGANLENLTLTGAGAIHGTGNALDNAITGNGGANMLSGRAGDDTLAGGGGADTLDGGSGDDSMVGGGGNDTYVVDSAADVVTEGTGANGIDTVRSSVDYVLTQTNIENLTLIGGGSIDGTGNSLANVVTGNNGNNVLSGGAGNDTLVGGLGGDVLIGDAGADSMAGGAGNDLYVVDETADTVYELAGRGVDVVESGISWTLSAHIEELVLSGGGNIDGTGNFLSNVITGNAGDNLLDGRGGADILTGGGGDDTLVWDAADAQLDGGAGVDTLRATGTATIDLDGRSGSTLTGFEIVELAGKNVLRLSAADVLAMSEESDTLRVDGGAGDAVQAAGLWVYQGLVTNDSANYLEFRSGEAVLQIREGINVSGVDRPASVLSLSALDGANGFRIDGTGADHRSGWSVASAGDVNGDGYDDLVVGAYGVYADTGRSYVVFGTASGFSSALSLGALNGANGYFAQGVIGGDYSGWSVASAGDVNGDGYGDLILGWDPLESTCRHASLSIL